MPTTFWSKYKDTIKDIVLIIGFLVSASGWIYTSAVKKTKMQNSIDNLTMEVKSSTDQLKEVNNFMMQQAVLNGKVIQHLQENNH